MEVAAASMTAKGFVGTDSRRARGDDLVLGVTRAGVHAYTQIQACMHARTHFRCRAGRTGNPLGMDGSGVLARVRGTKGGDNQKKKKGPDPVVSLVGSLTVLFCPMAYGKKCPFWI